MPPCWLSVAIRRNVVLNPCVVSVGFVATGATCGTPAFA
ncbi:hypothetical protein Y025_5747 [Burkholderia pseudomallei TSV32]|nr:hypothetical protein X989_5888 [Burkholderia pseudomallei MSHR4378]KGW37903.1 hypothetical protein Y047_6171 [Burkholderia pseudomallei MSHR3016]KGX48988.1 hypothetical protein Y025_5747 [Burkholderia pseudomallei TSV32]KGX94508.1 hypothetical protein X997_5837 [Burkholderia pseudomallei A79C]